MATDKHLILSQAERDRIREEVLLRDEIREEIATAMTSGSLTSRVRQTVLKSPVIATLVGGLLLNSFGLMKARDDKRQAQEHALLEKRIALLSAFAQDIEHVTAIEGSYKKAKLWLKDNPSADARNDLGMTRAQVLALYEDLWKLLMQSKPEKAILAEVRCFFDDPRLPAILDEAEKLREAMGDAQAENVRAAHRDEHEKVLKEIRKVLISTVLMRKE